MRGFGAGSSIVKTPSTVFNRLHKLPHHMAEIFGKPESAHDFFATLEAIAVLIECCDISFQSDEMGSSWRSMATWLTKVSNHFNDMVSRKSPAALVVLANWAALLVRRAELCGYWLFKGSAKKILALIEEQLPAEDRATRNLEA
jgi:hypothetical protein